MHCDKHEDWLVVYVGPLGSTDCPLCVADEEGMSSEEVGNMAEVLGVDVSDMDTSSTTAMSRVIVLASELRVRLGGVLQSLTGDGSDNIRKGVEVLEEIVKKYSERPDREDSITKFLSDVPDQNQLAALFEELGVDTVTVGSMRDSLTLAAAAVRDMGIMLTRVGGNREGAPVVEIQGEILTSYVSECDRRQATQDRVQSLLLRLTGECGEGLRTETMLDRIEASLGPVPEF